MEPTKGDSPLEDTAEIRSSLFGVVGPSQMTGRAGTCVRGKFALASEVVEDDVTVEWIAPARVLVQGGPTTTLEIDLAKAFPGEVRRFHVGAVLHGPDWRREIPYLSVELLVEA